MKWFFVLGLAVVVFGGAAFFGYNLFLKPELRVRAEISGEIPPEPTPDVRRPEFEAAAKLRQEGKLTEAREAFTAFLQKYTRGPHTEDAKDLLGEINMTILLSKHPSPEKQEYIVKSGDVLARIATKMKSTPELIMRTNNLSGTMLRIGERLLVSHPEFSVLIQRKTQEVVLLNHGQFFKRYRVSTMKLPAMRQPKITTRVAETMAWKDGKRVGFGSKDYVGSVRWIRLSAPGYVLFSAPEPGQGDGGVPPPETGLGMAASDVEELSGLVNGKTAVTITD